MANLSWLAPFVAPLLAALGLSESAAEPLAKATELLFGAEGREAFDIVKARFAAAGAKLPPNHDIEQVIRLAELTAALFVVIQYRRRFEADNVDTRSARLPPFIDRALAWLDGQLGFCAELKTVADDALVEELDSALNDILPARRSETVRAALAQSRQRIYEELVAGAGEPPEDFESFFSGSEEETGWPLTFLAFMREGLKANPRAEIAFVNTRLAALRTASRGFEDKLSGVKEDTGAIRRAQERAEVKIDAMHANLESLLESFRNTRQFEQARTEGVLEREIVELARRIDAKVNDVDQAMRELGRAVEIATDVKRQGERGTNLGEFVDDVLRRVAELSSEGRFEDAATAADQAFAKWKADESERQRAATNQGAALLRAGLNQDLLRRDAHSAARRIAAINDLETPDHELRLTKLEAIQQEWCDRGRDRGLNLDLEVAIELARIIVSRTRNRDARGEAQNMLGAALILLGEREAGTTRIEEAATAFRAALGKLTRKRTPLNWALAQSNLGNALARLGEREGRAAKVELAIAAYQAALDAMTRKRAPLEWALTQNNLGIALATLGERESGTTRLNQAVAAYRAALEEYRRERVPLDWAMAQNNLGNALQALGERESGALRLKEAVAAYRAALEERTREKVPLYWAMTQNNLGNALATLSDRENGSGLLGEAVEAYRAALLEYRRERVPLYWAMAQNNLGNALAKLGQGEGGAARLEEAVAAYRAALLEYTRKRVPLQWATTQNNLGNTLSMLGEREEGARRLEEAVAAYGAALEEWTPERAPLQWAATIGNQGVAMIQIADRAGDPAMAETAVQQIETAIAMTRSGGDEHWSSISQAQLPKARAIRDRLKGK